MFLVPFLMGVFLIMCEYAATTLSNLKTHKQSQHEGETFPCDQCEYFATALYDIKHHKQS